MINWQKWFLGVQKADEKLKSFFVWFAKSAKNFVLKHRGSVVVLALAVLATIIIISRISVKVNKPFLPNYLEVPVGLVPSKISESASVPINLPEGIFLTPTSAPEHISFEPKIKGQWQNGVKNSQLIFQPKEKLTLNKYYKVTLNASTNLSGNMSASTSTSTLTNSSTIKISKDFYVDEDPKILGIFPAQGTEAPETAEISITFNRPMVPLTSLEQLDKKPIHVKISPSTEGVFKWVTTRTLKFVPSKRLNRSSNYSVVVDDGWYSMDGLPVTGMASYFKTRPLRYLENGLHHTGDTLYSEPVVIRFNQPVDLEKTKNNISIINLKNNTAVSNIVEYGTRDVYEGNNNSLVKYTDKSVLRIFQSKDSYGRQKFWDNETNYSFKISGAQPLEGDIALSDERKFEFNVPNVLASLSASSQRSDLAELNLFDPQGTLVAQFYEDVNKDKLEIFAKGLKTLEYGEKCVLDENGDEIRTGNDCQKEPNKKEIILHFEENQFKPGETFSVKFNKIFNAQDLQINPVPIERSVSVYPALKVYSTSPKNNEQKADVASLVICTNSPLQDADETNFYLWFKSNITIGKWNWDKAFLILPDAKNPYCAGGQYLNTIRYGLLPESDYKISINLHDQFGQTQDLNLNFKSGKIAEQYKKLNSLQKDYNLTTPQLTKLTFAAENLDYVNVFLCRITSETMIKYLNGLDRPGETDPDSKLSCAESYKKHIELSKKYWSLNYFQVDLKDILPNDQLLGFYVLSLTNPDLHQFIYNYNSNANNLGDQIYDRTLINVTNLAAQEKKVEVLDDSFIPYQYQLPGNQDKVYKPQRQTEKKALTLSGGNLYWVSKLPQLEAAEDAKVSIYSINNKKVVSLDNAQTNSQGIARVKTYAGYSIAKISLNGDETLVSSATDKFSWAGSVMGDAKTYVYSDRPIYRPGQEVFIKGISRVGFDGEFEIYQDKPIDLEIFDSKNISVYKEQLKLNQNGTFNTKFVLSNDAALGNYRVEVGSGIGYFEVEEYKPAAFKLELKPDKEEYLAGENFKVNVDANYYFGVPVDGGQVQYSLIAQDYYFDRYSDGNFSFGKSWYYQPEGYYGDAYVLRGKTNLNQKGQAEITQKIDFEKFFKGESKNKSKIFVLRVTVKNSSGQSVYGEQSFIAHRGQFYLGAALQKNYFGLKDENKILIKSVDTTGQNKSVQEIRGKIEKISWDFFKRQEVDGGYYWHSEQKKELVEEFMASTDGSGNFSKDLKVKEAGEYLISIFAKDSLGNEIFASQDFYVYGQTTAVVRPLNNDSLDLAVEKNKLEVGEQGNIVIKSPFKKAKALIAIERGKIFSYEILDIDKNFYDYKFPIKEAYAPNIFVTVLLLSDKPEVKFGQAEFSVGLKEKQITVEVTPNKNNYLPGENVTLNVITKDSSGKAVSAEVSLAVADLSVLALVGNPKKDPVSFFYDGQPLAVTTASNLKNLLVEAEIPTGTKGGGGNEPEDLAKKKRGIFKDTAFWQAVVQTDQNGKAQIKFSLPDNLTTWQAEGVGVTHDTRLGVGYSQFVAKKDLMLTPLLPRFILPGDSFAVGAKIYNQTSARQTLQVSMQSGDLQILDKPQQKISIEANQSQTVYFKVKSGMQKNSGKYTLTLSAKNQTLEDTVESSLPVKRNETYEAVATSNYTKADVDSEYVWLPKNIVRDRGSVNIRAAATLIGNVQDALQYMVDYPYGCTEQMVSKINSLVAVRRLQNLKNVGDKLNIPEVEFDGQKYSVDDVIKIGLSRILANQTLEGGFAYYPQMKPDFYLSLNVLNALQDLASAGYSIDAAKITAAANFAFQTFNSNQNLYSEPGLQIITAYTFSRLPQTYNFANQLKPKISALIKNQEFINENISNLSLGYLAMYVNKFDSKNQDKVYKVLENRVVMDGRGAYLGQPSQNQKFYYYETPITDTAELLKAEVAAKRDFTYLPQVINWLRSSRYKDGSWGSTANTYAVLDSLVDFINWKQETTSQFNLSVQLNGTEKQNKEFNSQTILDTMVLELPVQDFSVEKLDRLDFVKKNLNNKTNAFYYDIIMKYYFPIEQIAPRDEGISVERTLYALEDSQNKTPLREAKIGEVLRGNLVLTLGDVRNYVNIESFIPAGFELVNFNLATEDKQLQDYQSGSRPAYGYEANSGGLEPIRLNKEQTKSGNWFLGWFGNKDSLKQQKPVAELPDEYYSGSVLRHQKLYPSATETHDDRLMLFNEFMYPGVYEYDFYVRALIPGQYQFLPTVASELYNPEHFGRSEGSVFTIK